MAEIELEDAIERSARNPACRWPERGDGSRLEPECWPELRPSFRLVPGSRVFTIGSCFARNVEHNLAALGFDIPARAFLDENAASGAGDEILNKYTPPSIYQELVWAKRIRDRDGVPSDEDIEPFLLDMGGGKVVDLQHRLTNQFGVAREKALEQRRALYGLFEKAFDSKTVIITLGLIECWLDRKTGQYVEFGPHMRRHNEGGRFVFKRLSFEEALGHTRKAIDLLLEDGPRDILITTSPVPLARTFTADDIIVANTYSKSVLRAVAGQIAQDYAGVDYFPSYESVMLTKQTYVWANDLTHVEGEFVGRVVARLCERYVADSGEHLPGIAATDKWLSFSNLVNHRRFEEAAQLFATLDPKEPKIAARFALAIAEMRMHLGQTDAALEDAQRALAAASLSGERGCINQLRCAKIWEAAGHAERAEEIRDQAIAALSNPALVMSVIRRFTAPDEAANLRRVVAHVEARLTGDLDVMAFMALTLETTGDAAGAERIYRVAIKAHPESAEIYARLGYLLLKQDRVRPAAKFLNAAVELEPQNPAHLKKLIDLHLKTGALDDAERVARGLISLSPADAGAHLNLASALRRSGRKDEALEAARRAVALDPANPRYAKYVDDLVKVAARR